MDVKWRDIVRPGSWRRLPSDTYLSLTRQLFGISASITITEAVLLGLIGGLAAARARDPWLWLMSGATAFLVILLIPASRHYLRKMDAGASPSEVRRLERSFEYHTWIISFGIGVMAARAVLGFTDTLVHLLLLLLTLGSMITNIRDHYRPLLPLGKTVALAGPVAIACLLSGDFYYQALGLGTIVASKLILDICQQLYRTTLAYQDALREEERLARELTAKNIDLEERECERIAQDAELKRLQMDLVQVSRLSAMGTMASALAHELNQPLTAVANYARGSRKLLDNPLPHRIAKAMEGLAAAEAGAIRAGQIVRRIRGLVHRGDAQAKPERLQDIIVEACELAFVDERLLGIQHVLDLPPGETWVKADIIQVQQVLVNLIRNAMDALQRTRDPVITISAHVSGTLVVIGVTDNGPGISEKAGEELFSPFNSTKEKGMGLGLSISRTIIEAHGGKIWSEPNPSGGAIFRFTLHCAKSPAEDAAEPRLIGRRGA